MAVDQPWRTDPVGAQASRQPGQGDGQTVGMDLGWAEEGQLAGPGPVRMDDAPEGRNRFPGRTGLDFQADQGQEGFDVPGRRRETNQAAIDTLGFQYQLQFQEGAGQVLMGQTEVRAFEAGFKNGQQGLQGHDRPFQLLSLDQGRRRVMGNEGFGVLASGGTVGGLSGGTQAGGNPVGGESCQLSGSLDAPCIEGLSECGRQLKPGQRQRSEKGRLIA